MTAARSLSPKSLFLHVSLFCLWIALLARGLATAATRYAGPSAPDYSAEIAYWFPKLLSGFGFLLAASLSWVLLHWSWLLAVSRCRRSAQSTKKDPLV